MAASNAELITNRYHIISLLQRASRSHAIVSLRRPHDEFVYNSTILSIDSEHNSFILDAPAEHELPLQAKPGDWLKFRIKLQGLVLSFDALIEDILEDEVSFLSYQIQFPSQVDYEQRRGAFRADIGYQFHAKLTAHLTSDKLLQGRLTDLSLSGVSVETDVSSQLNLRPDTPLKLCKLQMKGESIVINEAIIRTIQTADESFDVYRIGIEFSELSANERRSLQRWVMKFDRENRKSALSS